MTRWGLVVACTLVARTASAQPSQADKLFNEGQKLIDGNKVDEACDKFQASLELENALGTRLNLADCRERQKRFADAYELYADVVAEAGRTGKQTQLAFAQKRLDTLAPKLVRVTLKLGDATLAGLVVKLGTRSIPSPAWTRAIAVEPGALEIEATAPEREPFHATRSASAGDQITVEIPVLGAHAGPPPKPAVVDEPRSRMPLYVAGAGGALVVSSIIYGLHAKSVYNDGNSMVAPAGNSKIHTAVIEANVATAMFVVGAIGVGVGAYLYVRERGTAIVPTSDGHAVGAAVVGTW